MRLVAFDESFYPEFSSWFIELHEEDRFIEWYLEPQNWLNTVRINPSRFALAAISNDRMVGFADIEFDEDGNASFAFGIAPSLRQQGYGTKLLQEITSFVKAQGAKTILGGVDKQNRASKQLLVKAGFKRAGEDGEVEEYVKDL